MKPGIVQFIALWLLSSLPPCGHGAELGTRQRTIRPVALPTNTPALLASNIENYAVFGYSAWQWGPGEDAGQQANLMPAGYRGATNAARLLHFFAITDIHITDKETPSQMIASGYQSRYGDHGSPSGYSPTMLYTTHGLDAAIRTANAWHRLAPFDFAISLGDDSNSSQYNELRWFIDVMDGQPITPSSGAHFGASNIDYQMPYRAAGLDPAIPWYAVLGNHDRDWIGSIPVTDYLRQSYTNNLVLLMAELYDDGVGSRKPFLGTVDSRIEFMGCIDGSTPYGHVIGVGPVTNFVVGGVTNFPTVAPDPNRYSLRVSNWMREFFTTASQPVGHGFSPSNIANNFACYSFVPKANLPLKVIVLDDTMSDETWDSRGWGGLDTNQLAWLTQELQRGQEADQLMIIAAHLPLELVGYGASTNSAISATALRATLHAYPNLLLWIAGHVHMNRVLPQPSPDPAHPENGFWEVWTPSLKDFPRQFRTFDLLRNTDQSISIRTTDVDPEVTPGSPAATALGYAIGASRIFSSPSTNLTDTSAYVYNAELVKPLTPRMQTKIAGYGTPLGHRMTIEQDGTATVIGFLGTLQSADSILGPWTDVPASTSPYTVPVRNAAKFYRALE